MASVDVAAPARADNSYAPLSHSPDLASMDLDTIVHRIADLNKALALLGFGRETSDCLAALADERAELRREVERRAALLWARHAAQNAAAA